jgi:hypothetical protein
MLSTPASFSASTAAVTIGQSVTLQWAVPNAQTVRITDQSGRGVFTGTSHSGFVTVYPTKTRTYNLTASGVGVRLPGSITVTVTETPLPESLRLAQLELNQPSPLKAVQVGLSANISLKDVAVRLRPLIRLKSYSPLGMYGRLKRISVGLRGYDFAP